MNLVIIYCLVAVTTLLAQSPVPIWPQSNQLPADLKGQFVYWDPRDWQIVVVLQGESAAERRIVRLPFKNRFAPHISASLSQHEGQYVYTYAVRNGAAGVDPVQSWLLVTPCADSQMRAAGPHCGRAGVAVAPQLELPHLAERGCYETCFPELAQRPGSPPAHFTITSAYRPGLTTASASNYPPFEASNDWPEPVLLQLTKLGDLAWADMHLATIGPRFSPDTSIRSIAADFRDSLDDLIHRGGLRHNSAFVSEARAAFAEISQTGAVHPFQMRPETQLESEILEAALFSLGLKKTDREFSRC